KSVHLRRKRLCDVWRSKPYRDYYQLGASVRGEPNCKVRKAEGSRVTRRRSLTPNERAVFAGLADALLPAANGMPSATDADVHGKWIDRVLDARPDLQLSLVRMMRAVGADEPTAVLRSLEVGDPEGFATLVTLVAGAYYMNPRIRKLIRYPGQKKRPFYPD